jgi:hypothetical protein
MSGCSCATRLATRTATPTREQATVGALRKAAGDHDVSIHAMSKHDHGGVTDWQAQLSRAAKNAGDSDE